MPNPQRLRRRRKPPLGDEVGFDPMKWWLRSRAEIDEVQDRDIERSCSSKDAYRTEGEAKAHAAMNGMSSVLFTYHCAYCDQWHLTRQNRGGR